MRAVVALGIAYLWLVGSELYSFLSVLVYLAIRFSL